MDIRLILITFWTIFLAEVGDKTQLAIILYAADPASKKLSVFLGSALALVVASGIGVIAGSFLSNQIRQRWISWVAGMGFIAVGIWTIIKA
mgnify:FL=1